MIPRDFDLSVEDHLPVRREPDASPAIVVLPHDRIGHAVLGVRRDRNARSSHGDRRGNFASGNVSLLDGLRSGELSTCHRPLADPRVGECLAVNLLSVERGLLQVVRLGDLHKLIDNLVS